MVYQYLKLTINKFVINSNNKLLHWSYKDRHSGIFFDLPPWRFKILFGFELNQTMVQLTFAGKFNSCSIK
jgi:hypothetical protein